ncbi:hypothetical protein MC7420_2402 [Coleofasciculus chthonoplastes PCC 7420]|uniref:Uncharacterized protein n=1 Tax=Coleofasciculus chthonoplastes PCC 7420 TaxID=118168 RepID=B4W260_9CYAN|nr:hypothetical protein MC7420_2402 [Coleofasciculus chthonoplastes PCC 7420]
MTVYNFKKWRLPQKSDYPASEDKGHKLFIPHPYTYIEK